MTNAILLTDAKIQGLKSPAKGQTEISDAQVPGLRLRIGTTGAKSFIVRKRIGGKVKVITIGRYGPRLSLAEARKRARDILSDIDKDVAVERIREVRTTSPAKHNTIAALWPEYKKTKAEKRSIGEIERIFKRYIIPEIGDRMADAVTRSDVTRFIDSIDKPVMARAVYAQLSAFYTWALPRLDNLPANPCIGAGKPAKPEARDRVLSEAELVGLWHVLATEPEPWQSAIKLLILTGQRRSEVIEASWPEFDLGAALWTIPAAKAKNGATHLVPLSKAAVGVLEGIDMADDSTFLFPATGNPENPASGISKTVTRIRSKLADHLGQDVPQWGLHDIRRTVATNLQRLGIRFEVTEAVLNHVSGSKGGIAGVYQRHDWADEKRTALEAWAADLARMIDGRKADNVVKLHG